MNSINIKALVLAVSLAFSATATRISLFYKEVIE